MVTIASGRVNMEVVGIDCERPSPIFRKVTIVSIVSKVPTGINDKHPWDNLFNFFLLLLYLEYTAKVIAFNRRRPN